MLKDHKKRHREMAKARRGGSEEPKANCCTPTFVNRPQWGTEPGPALPMRWITGVRARDGQR